MLTLYYNGDIVDIYYMRGAHMLDLRYDRVKIIRGDDAIKDNYDSISGIGRKAFLVTGKNSAVRSGARDEITEALEKLGIPYVIFDKVTENPKSLTCFDAGKICRENCCDFVIGIGGGSVIDASKAIACYALHEDFKNDTDIFECDGKCLPIVAVVTTSGTGSEANRYSVLTVGDNRKISFKSEYSYPLLSFVCPKFTVTMNDEQTVSTALDAFAHSIESFLSPKSDEISENAALYSGREIWNVLLKSPRDPSCLSLEDREKLSYAADYAGIAIDITGTGFPHPLGYGLTIDYGIPHGKACAVFEKDFIKYNMRTEKGREKIERFSEYIGASPEEIMNKTYELSGINMKLTDDIIANIISRVEKASNFANSPYVLNKKEMFDIYKELFE